MKCTLFPNKVPLFRLLLLLLPLHQLGDSIMGDSYFGSYQHPTDDGSQFLVQLQFDLRGTTSSVGFWSTSDNHSHSGLDSFKDHARFRVPSTSNSSHSLSSSNSSDSPAFQAHTGLSSFLDLELKIRQLEDEKL